MPSLHLGLPAYNNKTLDYNVLELFTTVKSFTISALSDIQIGPIWVLFLTVGHQVLAAKLSSSSSRWCLDKQPKAIWRGTILILGIFFILE
jgi:hypothetical protein